MRLWLVCLVMTAPVAAFISVTLVIGLGGCSHSPRHAPRHHARRHPRGACVELAKGTSQLYACEDGRGYLVTLGVWRDVGPLSAVPPVPEGG